MLNLDQLIAIEDQAARACAGWLRRQAAEIRADLPSLEGELLAPMRRRCSSNLSIWSAATARHRYRTGSQTTSAPH